MPRHQHATTCRKTGGPISKHCTCEHCNLSVCRVCGGYEGGLTTDCPGTQINFEKQREIYETSLDYTDARGWHQGEPQERRIPRFTNTRRPPEPPRPDPRTVVSPTIDWTKIDRNAALQHELTLRGIAWVLADRDCDILSAALTRVEEAAAAADLKHDLTTRLKEAQSNFQQASRLVEKRDDEFRQAARELVAALETTPAHN